MLTGRQITTVLTVAVALVVLTCAALTSPAAESAAITFGNAEVTWRGKSVTQSGYGACGFLLAADEKGPQVAMMLPGRSFVACVEDRESVDVSISLEGVSGKFSISCVVDLLDGQQGKATISIGKHSSSRTVRPKRALKLEVEGTGADEKLTLRMVSGGSSGETAVRWRELRVLVNGAVVPIPATSGLRRKRSAKRHNRNPLRHHYLGRLAVLKGFLASLHVISRDCEGLRVTTRAVNGGFAP